MIDFLWILRYNVVNPLILGIVEIGLFLANFHSSEIYIIARLSDRLILSD
jgi:hypothetical protein